MIFKHQLVLPSPPSLGFRPLLHVPLTGQNNATDVVHLPFAVGQEVFQLTNIELQLVHILTSSSQKNASTG